MGAHKWNRQACIKKRSLIGHAYCKQHCAASFNLSVHFELKRQKNLCEHGSHSPSTRLFGCKLQRGGTCTTKEAVQVVDYLFSVWVTSLLTTSAKSKSFSRKDTSEGAELKQTIVRRTDRKRKMILLEEIDRWTAFLLDKILDFEKRLDSSPCSFVTLVSSVAGKYCFQLVLSQRLTGCYLIFCMEQS